jgi:hypothetical protein
MTEIRTFGPKRRAALWTSCAVVAWLALTYNPGGRWSGWWLSGIGTVCILLCMRRADPAGWIDRLGLRVSRGSLLRAAGLLAVVLVGTILALQAIARERGVTFTPRYASPGGVPHYLHTIAQTLNEEMILGALLLLGLRRRWPRLRPAALSIAVAAAFALFHLAFYGARPASSPNHGVLALGSVAGLFLVGVLRNNLILATGHVAYSEAVHLGWNAVFLGGTFRDASTGRRLTEPELFDVFVGAPVVVAVALAAAAASFALLRRRRSRAGGISRPRRSRWSLPRARRP